MKCMRSQCNAGRNNSQNPKDLSFREVNTTRNLLAASKGGGSASNARLKVLEVLLARRVHPVGRAHADRQIWRLAGLNDGCRYGRGRGQSGYGTRGRASRED